jgi:hypothetical protein
MTRNEAYLNLKNLNCKNIFSVKMKNTIDRSLNWSFFENCVFKSGKNKIVYLGKFQK